MATLITNSKFKQFDADGEPLASGKVYTYIVGTTTNKVTYQDEALTTPNTNPIILDAWGEATIWIDGDTKLYVTDSNDAEIRTYDSFSDSGSSTGETPVISSPEDAVLRSTSTETGYIKIQLPMGEWPNTKMMFDVNVYTDLDDKSFKLTLGGFANSTTSSWETVTALTNGKDTYDVQFGNDGTYPCVYIGAVDSEWIKPQISVSNFLAGEFSYSYNTWDNGWSINITTSLGTITDSTTAISGVGPWVEVTDFESDFQALSGEELSCRLVDFGRTVQITGSIEQISGSTGLVKACTLPIGYRPYNKFVFYSGTSQGDFSITCGTQRTYILTDGSINLSISDTTWNQYITIAFPAS